MFSQGSKSNLNIANQVYRPLIFESILRNYQQPSKHVSLIKSSNVKVASSSSQSSFKVDLSKKMKISKLNSKKQEENKENIDMNGIFDPNKYLHDTNKMSTQSQRSSPVLDIQGNVNQFLSKYHDQFIEESSVQQKDLIHQCQVNEPEIIKCSVIQREAENGIQIKDQKLNLNQNNRQIFQNEQKLTESSQSAALMIQSITPKKEKKQSNSYHIKNKISVRILKKKLKSHSLEQVIEDLVKHRKIIIDTTSSSSVQLNVAEALLSFVRSQLLQ